MSNDIPRLAERLRELFDNVPREPGGSKMHTSDSAAAALRAMGIQVSASTIDHLRSGRSANPSAVLLDGIARLFAVPVDYFLDDQEGERIRQELHSLIALRDAGVKKVMLRASGLSREGLENLAEIAARFRRYEGLEEPQDGDTAG